MNTTPRRLPSSSFAVVMGTTIVAVDLEVFGHHGLAVVLLVIGVAAYVVVGIGSLWRLARDRDALVAELRSPAAGPGHLTAVAATAVLGTGLARIGDATAVPVILVLVAIAVLVASGTLLIRSVPAASRTGPAWLLLAVAPLSTSILVSGLAEHLPQPTGWLVAAAGCVAGLVAYVTMIGPVVRRLRTDLAVPASVAPAHWIDAGLPALWAISLIRLADSTGADGVPGSLADLAEPLRAVAVGAWVLAMMLSPLALALGVWRHSRGRVPFRYDTGYWSLVFPTGIITLATAEVARVTTTAWLRDVAEVWSMLVFVLWLAIGAAMVQRWLPDVIAAVRATTAGRTPISGP